MANDFNSPDRMSDFSLKVSYWYVVHKLLLKKLLISGLIVLNVGLFGYAGFRLGWMIFVDGPAYAAALNQLTTPLIDYSTLRANNHPADLELESFEALPMADDRYDFAVKLANPNDKHIAERVTVQLVSGGEVVAEKTTFVYPRMSTYVMFFNQTVPPNATELRIAAVNWQRFLGFAAFAEPRLRLKITDAEFIPAGSASVGSSFPSSILRFTIKNEGAYGYWQVGTHLVLLSGQGIGGINYLVVDQLRAGESRTVEMRWLQPLPTITDFEIVPEVDLMHTSSYLPVE
ncbi:MAG: hypothetical protein A3J59_02180 [Candidatus Buchananbacteria bacterium RIFCSPHIGHO2_02_FULL_56_16]|uniref:Uncharacterized protein n=1 Tax=Candidatus Buchananbacteria bacterium RIFCSPHIGHO2_02_FULL_56_16 TaxID=1797542 RepID=A0A1G1YKT3_9BACT|nr:MAG: hypothetical protein A3J59_02180 [Candidatus Buchananbacteria bacterium RIFCSPHIGHO2_02_FULL_56_16]